MSRRVARRVTGAGIVPRTSTPPGILPIPLPDRPSEPAPPKSSDAPALAVPPVVTGPSTTPAPPAETDASDRPPSERGFFRTWRRLYAAVLVTELALVVLFLWFSRTFSG